MTQMHSRARSAQSGVSAFEAVLSLAVVAALVILFATLSNGQSKDLRLASVASRMTEVRSASDRYIRDNFSTLETNATAGPVVIPMPTLVAGNYLPGSYSNTNEFGASHQVYVRRRAAGVLESLVVTTGGQAMNQLEGGKVATLLKGPGGFVPVGSGAAQGTKGGWTATLASFVPGGQAIPSGSPAAFSLIRKFDGPSGALMRDDTGNPADNRMGTNLDMDWHDILNVRNINVGNTTINQNTVQNINDLAAVSCASGEVLTKVGATIMCVPQTGMPSGGVAGFSGSCPSGWSSLGSAAGRVLVGAGNGLSAGQSGGNDFLTLTPEQMPAHNHRVVVGVGPGSGQAINESKASPLSHFGTYGSSTEYLMTSGSGNDWMGASQTVGGGQGFDNRQSYYVVNYCQKQ